MSAAPDPSASELRQHCPQCGYAFSPTAADPTPPPGATGAATADTPPPGATGAVTVDTPPAAEAATASAPDGHGAAAATNEPMPQTIARFQIERFVGEGSFGRVYQAHDPSLKRTVALKVARAEQLRSR